MFKTRIIMHFNKAAAANLKTLYNLESVNAEGEKMRNAKESTFIRVLKSRRL